MVLTAMGTGRDQQITAREQRPTFRSRVELVVVRVTVADRDGRPIAGLVKEDFVVLEHGMPQEVSHFLSSAVPLDDLARETGGQVFRSDEATDLTQAYARIARELSTQYVPAYAAPSAKRSGFQTGIDVRIPLQPGTVARAHVGYMNRTPSGG